MEKIIRHFCDLGIAAMSRGEVFVVADDWKRMSGGVSWRVKWGRRMASEGKDSGGNE